MSDSNILSISKKTHAISVGVCKFDFQQLGFPDVNKIAQDLKKDPYFVQIIVRKVSKENWGIQYIYAIPHEELAGVRIWTYLRSTYEHMFTKTYALDLTFTENDGIELQWVHQVPFVITED